MINDQIIQEITRKTQAFWNKEVRKDSFSQIARGKEIGHRIADLVDDKTTGLLAINYTTRYQRDRRGNKLPRSMGDIWLESGDIYHPINVKTGVSATNGQPNMVSLKKLLDALLDQQIDSYYLLMVKLDLQPPITCLVHFIDMLDYLDYVTFDSGPGQIMLKSRLFFPFLATQKHPSRQTMKQKVEQLVALLEDGERRLIENRKRDLGGYRTKAQVYTSLEQHLVTPLSQESLNLR